jgi:hypothetical protein
MPAATRPPIRQTQMILWDWFAFDVLLLYLGFSVLTS